MTDALGREALAQHLALRDVATELLVLRFTILGRDLVAAFSPLWSTRLALRGWCLLRLHLEAFFVEHLRHLVSARERPTRIPATRCPDHARSLLEKTTGPFTLERAYRVRTYHVHRRLAIHSLELFEDQLLLFVVYVVCIGMCVKNS